MFGNSNCFWKLYTNTTFLQIKKSVNLEGENYNT